MAEELSVFAGVTVGDRWDLDPISSEWRCGDLVIAVEGDNPTRYFVSTVGGRHLFGGQIQDACSPFGTFSWFRGLLAYDAQDDVPTAGLEPWFEAAQQQADAAYEDEIERIRAAREEWEASRVGRTASQLLAETPVETEYLIPGFVAAGWAVKLAGREKIGKGTFVYYSLGKLERGEDTLFGPGRGTPVTAVIVTEEPMESVREKVERFGLENARIIYGWELAHLSWPDKITRIISEAIEDGHSLVFIDNISRSASVEDENGTEMARAVELLQDACRKAGLTLLIDHHHKKGRDSVENKSRGGTALAGAVEVNVEMERVGGWTSRRRRLSARGRMRSTIWEKTIELNEDGTDYVLVEDGPCSHGDSGTLSKAAQTLMADRMILSSLKQTTAAGFAETIGTRPQAARNRLNALVAAGHAIVEPGPMTANGKEPSIYRPVRPEPSVAVG